METYIVHYELDLGHDGLVFEIVDSIDTIEANLPDLVRLLDTSDYNYPLFF